MLKGMPKGMKGLHQNMKRGSNLGEEAALAGNAGNITGAATGAGPQFKKGGKAKLKEGSKKEEAMDKKEMKKKGGKVKHEEKKLHKKTGGKIGGAGAISVPQKFKKGGAEKGSNAKDLKTKAPAFKKGGKIDVSKLKGALGKKTGKATAGDPTAGSGNGPRW